MRNPETMLRVYEELASRFIAQNEPRFRDHCFVLAADSAVTAQRPQEAERLRTRLLQHNPHHLLRPFASMAEALQAPDVQEYVADLRRQWPPEFVEKLYLDGSQTPLPPEPPPAAHTVAPPPAEPAVATPLAPKQIKVPPRPAPVAAPVVARPVPVGAPIARPVQLPATATTQTAPPVDRPSGGVLATGLLLVGIAGGVGLVFLTFVWPLLH